MNLKSTLFIASFLMILANTFAQRGEVQSVSLEKISENLYLLTGGRGASGGIYIGEREVLVIDSKMDEASVKGIFDAVSTVTDKPITKMINTHSDGDHVNGNQFFPETVSIIAHENCRKEMLGNQRNGEPSIWLKPELQSFLPEITFKKYMTVHMGNQDVELHYFGIGHTTGDIVVFFPKEKTAFIGDQVFFGRPQLIHAYKGGNSFEHVKTARKLLSLDAEKFCSGHADIKNRNDLEKHISSMIALQEKVKSNIAAGKSLEETLAVFDENESRLVTTVFNEINGNLELH